MAAAQHDDLTALPDPGAERYTVFMDRGRLLARGRRLMQRAIRLPAHVRDRFRRSSLPSPLDDVAHQVRQEGLSYLSIAKLDKLGHAVLAVKRRGVEGAIIEAGCALGGSTVLLAAAKNRDRPLRVYDVFGTIPPPTTEDGPDVHQRYEVIASGKSRGLRGGRYYGYETDLYDRVKRTLARYGYPPDEHGIELIAGRVEDTLEVDEPVSLAHVDVDWYQPVRTCLERIAPRLSTGGMIILDDYFDWSGCHKATDEYLARTTIRFVRDRSGGSLRLTRI